MVPRNYGSVRRISDDDEVGKRKPTNFCAVDRSSQTTRTLHINGCIVCEGRVANNKSTVVYKDRPPGAFDRSAAIPKSNTRDVYGDGCTGDEKYSAGMIAADCYKVLIRAGDGQDLVDRDLTGRKSDGLGRIEK